MHWHLLVSPALSGPENMALDEALLRRAQRTGDAVCRVYTWREPTLSFGRNQTARGHYDAGLARELGVAVVRRPTGGRAVLHHRELTYSVTAPLRDAEPLRESYGRVNRLLLDALRALGVDARLAERGGRAPVPSAAPCFEAPTVGELVLDGRKLAGSAQWRDEGAFLQHGSILVDDDQALVPRLALHPVPVPAAPATLRAALGRAPTADELGAALLLAIRAREDAAAARWDGLEPALRLDAEQACQRYRDDHWTWRR
ncbi:MAG TPA: lipoate--protein ligase family protein [Gemmatimonadaceae bacterium]|nr:lipoate--protein ligase family protein [Gemmatimonadaceae bacterium]